MQNGQTPTQWLEGLLPDRKPHLSPSAYLERASHNFNVFKHFLQYMYISMDGYEAIHVAGTSGKGSTTMMIEAMLRARGEKTGSYTSPYMQIPNEKIRIDGKMIAQDMYSAFVEDIAGQYANFTREFPEASVSYSSMWAALAFLAFAYTGVSAAAIETSLGGRFDATNVITPAASVITNIGLDHTAKLGSTLASIAWHKAGIIKEGIPVVTAEKKPEALRVLQEEARKKGAKLYVLGQDFLAGNIRAKQNGSFFDLVTPFCQFRDVWLPLVGSYQVENASLAVMAVLLVAKVKEDAAWIRSGLNGVIVPGRMEIMQYDPLVVIDGAHNPDKMRAAAQAMQSLVEQKKITVVIATTRKGNIRDMLAQVLPFADKIITTSLRAYKIAGYDPERLGELIKHMDKEKEVMSCLDPHEAVRLAIATGNPVLVTGSLYLMQQVREIWFPKEELLKDVLSLCRHTSSS